MGQARECVLSRRISCGLLVGLALIFSGMFFMPGSWAQPDCSSPSCQSQDSVELEPIKFEKLAAMPFMESPLGEVEPDLFIRPPSQMKSITVATPLLFRREIRLENAFIQLKPKDTYLNVLATEYIHPFFNGRAGIRTVLPLQGLHLPNATEYGLGDTLTRFSYFALMTRKWAWLVGNDVLWPTATRKLLGSRNITIGPRTVIGYQLGKHWLVAPAYQYEFSAVGAKKSPDIRFSRFDLNIAWHTRNFKRIIVLDPALFISQGSQHGVSSTIRLEIDQVLGKGFMIYFRPGIGLGNTRPYDYTIEGGIRYAPYVRRPFFF